MRTMLQGFYDPFCTDLAAAPGGEGCFRCLNGGNCTAPDFCECAEGWTGYDCSIPVCEVVATPLMRDQLDTDDEEVISQFENDPCTMLEIHDYELFEGYYAVRGNCTAPNECTCFCKAEFQADMCAADDSLDICAGPFQDPMLRARDLLGKADMFGTRDCIDGCVRVPPHSSL